MDKVTDNVELDFPARMSDGRQFTDYRPNCLMNYSITGDKGSWAEKYYMIHQASHIHDSKISKLETDMACEKCTDNTVLPVKTDVTCYPDTCKYNVVNKEGLGQATNYQVTPKFLQNE